MKPKRVNCADCAEFRDYYIKKHKCRIGKRVMFRTYGHPDRNKFEAGYFRYCDEFKEIEKID